MEPNPNTGAASGGEDVNAILDLLDQVKSELQSKLDANPESKGCKTALDLVSQAYDALSSEYPAKENTDIKGMEDSKMSENPMTKLMEE